MTDENPYARPAPSDDASVEGDPSAGALGYTSTRNPAAAAVAEPDAEPDADADSGSDQPAEPQ